MVSRQEKDPVLLVRTEQGRAEQWPPSQVERQPGFVGAQPPGLGFPLSRGQLTQVYHRQLERFSSGDDGARLPRDCRKRGAEGFVASPNLAETLLQRSHIESSGDAQGGGAVVLSATGLQLIEEPQALLSERQWQVVRARHR